MPRKRYGRFHLSMCPRISRIALWTRSVNFPIIIVVMFKSSYFNIADPCASQPCLNHATCMRDNGGFRCVCPVGYTGARCEILDACQSSPCMNGGTCQLTNGNGGYQCLCPSGFTGSRCETRKLLKSWVCSFVSYHCLIGRWRLFSESLLEWSYLYTKRYWRVHMSMFNRIYRTTMRGSRWLQ